MSVISASSLYHMSFVCIIVVGVACSNHTATEMRITVMYVRSVGYADSACVPECSMHSSDFFCIGIHATCWRTEVSIVGFPLGETAF